MKDRLMKKQTKQEQFLHERIQKMRDEFELRMLNIVAQVRSVAIAAGVSPEAFIEAFMNQDKQQDFFKKQAAEESRIIGEYQKKRAEQEKQVKENVDPNLAKFMENQKEFVQDIIEGPNEKII